MSGDKRNTVIQANRTAKTVIEVFDRILKADSISQDDLHLLVDRITIYDDAIEVQLKSDVRELLCCGVCESDALPEDAVIVQKSANRPPRELKMLVDAPKTDNVISSGDPLEIFTDKDGEVIFKKYSPIGELSDFAAQICESLHKSTDAIAAVCDRDSIIAISGGARRELMDKRVSASVERIMEARSAFRHEGGSALHAVESDDRYCISVAAPIISEGDILGCVLFISPNGAAGSDIELKLAQTVASFLGKQMES